MVKIFLKKGAQIKTKVITFFSKGIFGFWIFLSLQQLMSVPTRFTKNTATLMDHLLTNSPHKITQSGGIEWNLSDHELIYCMRKTTKFKSNKHNKLNILSMKNYTAKNVVEHLKKWISQIMRLILAKIWLT